MTKYGFSLDFNEQDIKRRCSATAYARTQGTYMNDSYLTVEDEPTCIWWLRSPGNSAYCAAVVEDNGLVGSYGYYVGGDYNSPRAGVRPALYVNRPK